MKVILTIVLIGLAAGAAYYGLQMRTGDHEQHDHAQEIYYCPMHPQIQSDRPGDCPICHMKLVKKESGQASSQEASSKAASSNTPSTTGEISGHAGVHMNDHQRQLIGIQTTPVIKKPILKTIHTYGYVAHDFELYDAQLEYIDAWRAFYPFLYRRAIKDEFKADWREYYLNPPDDKRWRSDEKVKAQQRLVKAESDLIHMGITENELKKLREIKYGQPWIRPDLLYYGENYAVWIYAQIFESDLGFVSPTQKVSVTIPAYGETVQGVVESVTPVIDPATRTARVRIKLSDYRGELSVNMLVNVEIPVELDEGLVVPRQAVMDTGLRKIVYVEVAEGYFEPRMIRTGFEGDGMVIVKSGLNLNEKVVVDGNFLLDSESRLKSAIEGVSQDTPEAHIGH